MLLWSCIELNIVVLAALSPAPSVFAVTPNMVSALVISTAGLDLPTTKDVLDFSTSYFNGYICDDSCYCF